MVAVIEEWDLRNAKARVMFEIVQTTIWVRLRQHTAELWIDEFPKSSAAAISRRSGVLIFSRPFGEVSR